MKEETSVAEKKISTRCRSFMDKFGDYYSGGRGFVLIPLCRKDNYREEESFSACKHIEIDMRIN